MFEFLERTSYLLGQESVELLQGKHVAIFGIGGVGGYVCEALARSGIGTLTLVDHDTISLSNINRQIIATYDTLGQAKTAVMAARLRSINPAICVIERQCFFLPDTADSFSFSEYDYVVDAVDTVTAKLLIIQKAKEAAVPVISCMGTGNKRNPSLFEITDIRKTSVCPLAKVMRRELKQRGIEGVKVLYSKEEPITPRRDSFVSEQASDNENRKPVPGSIAFVPPVAGLLLACEVVNDLTRND